MNTAQYSLMNFINFMYFIMCYFINSIINKHIRTAMIFYSNYLRIVKIILFVNLYYSINVSHHYLLLTVLLFNICFCFFVFRQHEICLQLRDTQNAEYLGEIYLDVTLTPQSREEREQVIIIDI